MTEQARSLRDAARALVEWELQNPAAAAAVRAEERRRIHEIEAEQYAYELAEQLWRQRGAVGDGPTVEDRAEADRAALAILNQIARDSE